MRIAFVISDQHATPAGGIGQFAKGFVEQIATPNGIFVDFVLDKQPSRNFISSLNFKGSIYYPLNPVSYSTHLNTFAFGESLNWEKHINFRDSMMRALKNSLYDLIIVNTPEAYSTVYGLCLSTKTKIVFYTHSEYLAGFEDYTASTFYQEYIDFYKNSMRLPNVTIGTQTNYNRDRCLSTYLKNHSNIKVLPMPIPEKNLLIKNDSKKKEGVLFIGRWEDRKNPEAFIKVISETKAYAKIMTNETGAKKFKAALDKIGASYDIRVNIIGDEKVDFISSAAVYFNPSKLESFGFSMLEGLSQCQTVVLSDYSWHDNFLDFQFKKSELSTVTKDINLLLSKPQYDNTELVKEYNKKSIDEWMSFIHEPMHTKKLDRAFKSDDFWYDDYLTDLNRDVSIEDIISVYNHKSKFSIVDTTSSQWFSKTGAPPQEKETEFF